MNKRPTHPIQMIRWLTLLPLLLSGVCSQAQTAAGFFVAVNGNDGWSGRWAQANAANLPAAARGQVWVAEAPKELSDFFTMYEGDQRLPRARGQGFGPADFVDVKTSRADQLKFPPGAMRNWPGLQDAELLVIPTAD